MHDKSHKLREIEEEIMEALFDLHLSLCDESHVKMKHILNRIGPNVSKTQLTNIVQRKLEKLGYVHYQPYEGIRLTNGGFQVAQKIARNHRLAEAMLFQIFRIPFEFIHEQACFLEHAISDMMAEHIYAVLPEKTTPFGITIPMKGSEDFACSDQTIVDTAEGSTVILERVSIHNHNTARNLLKLGINGKGVKIKVIHKSEKGIKVNIEGSEYIIPQKLAGTLYVNPI